MKSPKERTSVHNAYIHKHTQIIGPNSLFIEWNHHVVTCFLHLLDGLRSRNGDNTRLVIILQKTVINLISISDELFGEGRGGRGIVTHKGNYDTSVNEDVTQ